METLVVFSHLRWNAIYQRPQHLLSRLAAHYRILYVEEPITGADELWVEFAAPHPGVEVLQLHSPLEQPGFHDAHLPYFNDAVQAALAERDWHRYGVWFYTPMAIPMLRKLQPAVVVYDRIDELSGFRHAPRQLAQRESALLRVADVVFTGGASLYEAKRSRHDNVHCFPSGVDAEHFSATVLARAAPELGLGRAPRLGYYGVVDERLDLPLLRALAELRPDWQFDLVGPVVNIDVASLRQYENVHFHGQQPYARLREFLAGWSVCLLPFVLNDATRCISPTKTPEYLAAGLAAGRAVVATPVPDVVREFEGVVRIASGPEAFASACDEALAECGGAALLRRKAGRALVALRSWDATAASMHALIDAAVRERPRSGASAILRVPPSADAPPAAARTTPAGP